MALKDFTKELNGERVEGELVKTILYSLLTSIVVLLIAYYFKLRYIENFIPKYGFFLFFAVLSYSLIVPTIKQIRAYNNMACMSGMMVGMTIGMISGFLAGFFIGATNGMFVGGTFGMAVGVILGVWMGSCCGVMGFMEGIMAGLMGGWMGAMTSVMLLNDHLKIATFLIFLVSAIILVALNYMIYLETKESEIQRKEGHLTTLIVSSILILTTILIILFAPRGILG